MTYPVIGASDQSVMAVTDASPGRLNHCTVAITATREAIMRSLVMFLFFLAYVSPVLVIRRLETSRIPSQQDSYVSEPHITLARA